MSLGTSNRDGGKTSESGHLRAVYKALIGEVLSGLAVSQRAAGANMSVDIAIGDAVLPRSDGTYGHPAFNDAVLNKTITTADPSNPRRDIVVLYLDYAVTPSTGVSNNTNGVVAAMVVAGTPAGSPSDPSDATIQSAVGSGNPWVKLARVRVGAGVTSLANSVIDDLRRMAHGLSQGGWIYDSSYAWAYASATTFTVAGADVRTQFPKGTKLALYQSGTIKYFVVTDATFSTNTTVTVSGMGLYTLANVPIDKPALSYEHSPVGFPVPNAYNPYKFRATRTAAFTPTASTFNKIPCETESYDTGNNYDNVTNYRFTAPVTGFYEFTARTSIGVGANGRVVLCLYKNGVIYSRGYDGSAGATGYPIGGTLSDTIQLSAGDYVEFYLYSVNATALEPTSDITLFAGHLVSAA